MTRTIKCRSCGELKTYHAKGKCKNCYHRKEIICPVCGENTVHWAKGKCRACYRAWAYKNPDRLKPVIHDPWINKMLTDPVARQKVLDTIAGWKRN